MRDETVFVAGATGFTGRAVVAELRRRGARVTAHVRPDSPQVDVWRNRFGALGAKVDTTAWQLAAMSERLQALSPGVVFSLLGTTRARARAEGRRAKEAYEAVDVGLTLMLLGACESCERSPRFVYLSAIGAESGRGTYMSARKRVEDRLRGSALPWIVARPSFIVGERDRPRAGERIGAKVADGMLDAAGMLGARSLRERYRSTTNLALAERLVDLALLEEAAPGVYEGPHLHRV